eukprot:12398474-Karenia_brevis.AAC.2
MSSALVTRAGRSQKRTMPLGAELRSWHNPRKSPWGEHGCDLPGAHGEPKSSIMAATQLACRSPILQRGVVEVHGEEAHKKPPDEGLRKLGQ